MAIEADTGIRGKRVGAMARVELLMARAGVGVPRIPCWESNQLPMPNVFLAASVFGMTPVQAAPVMVHRMRLEAAPGYEVRYTGRLLNQTHGDLVMALMALSAESEVDSTVTVRASDLERILERKGGSYNRKLLRVLLDDLVAAALYVTAGKLYHAGTLLPLLKQDGDVHTLRINAKMMHIAHGGFTLIDRAARLRLSRKPLAQWLQLYTAWHESQGVRAVELSDVERVSRSASERRKLRFLTHEALDALGEAGVRPWRLGADDVLRAG